MTPACGPAGSPISMVLARAEQFGVRPSGQGRWRMRGACHDGKRTLSVAIAETPDGAVLLHCFGGCQVDRILQVLGLQAHELFPPRAKQAGRPAGTGGRAVARPYSAIDLVRSLSAEMRVVWVLLSDVANGRQLGEEDRRRAGVARQRCLALIEELEHAR